MSCEDVVYLCECGYRGRKGARFCQIGNILECQGTKLIICKTYYVPL